jgi:hypothetical protein
VTISAKTSSGNSTSLSVNSVKSAALAIAATATTGTITSGGVTATPNVTNNTWNLTGTGTAGTSFVVMEGNTVVGTAVVGSNGLWSLTLASLPSGQNQLNVYAVDAYGNAVFIAALTISA